RAQFLSVVICGFCGFCCVFNLEIGCVAICAINFWQLNNFIVFHKIFLKVSLFAPLKAFID
ncbi:hypothetical protein, partial [Citrobacter freundii]|uniref:hypothetical protein n=1 Tax=Citrobacter freundii TaxID=546 RepID=UPI001CD592CD